MGKTMKIKASGIAEVVIALVIISICFSVASLVFIRATSSSMKFQDVKTQTEIQSIIFQKLKEQNIGKLSEDYTYFVDNDLNYDSLQTWTFTGTDERVLWNECNARAQLRWIGCLEINAVNEFEDLALVGNDAPTAISLLD